NISIGLGGGVVGAALLWLVLRSLQLGEVLGTAAQLALVIGVAAGCDVFADDTGLVAAIAMGIAAANLRGIDIPARRPFFETLAQLIIGLLFISISATVTPQSLRGLILPAIGLVAVLVLAVRPAVAWLSTARSDLTGRERAFIGWMAPRGIAAAGPASTFSTGLVSAGVAGGEKVLPATFLRRLAAMLAEVAPNVRAEHRPAVDTALGALAAAVRESYPDPASRTFAADVDHQGIGGPPEPDSYE